MIPRDIFVQSAKELREIVWWNERLTKLSQVADTSHIDEMLVETDGPYIEKVNPPAYYEIHNPIPWDDFAFKLEISEEVTTATRIVLFKGEKNLPLYHHQGEAISHICRKAMESGKREDIVLSVPTATGKTEAFLIPILDYCVARRKEQQRYEQSHPPHSLKALIIYPMKTLEVDQLNRFVEYLYYINKSLKEGGWRQIRIGIWDGDTPTGVSDAAEQWSEDYDSYGVFAQKSDGARGLKCPKHREQPLVYYDDTKLHCSKGDYFDWILMTREGIKNGVDILITNPEALSHLLISFKNKDVVLSDDVKYIVIDEAHTWKGVSGSVFSVFLQRLRALYEKSNPIIVLSSATISRPIQFGKKLLHVDNIKVVEYRTYLDIVDVQGLSRKANFQRIPHTRFDYSMLVLLGAEYVSENEKDIADYLVETKRFIPDDRLVINSIGMLQLLDLVKKKGENIEITSRGREVLDLIKVEKSLTGDALLSGVQEAVESLPFTKKWTEIICDDKEGLPEIVFLSENIFGKQRFMREVDIVEKIRRESQGLTVERGIEILSTLLSFGRISEIIFDKYHFFLKPISSLFLCTHCNTVNTTQECPNDPEHREVYPLLFCKRCHSPAIQKPKKQLVLLSDPTNGSTCDCGRNVNFRNFGDVFLHYGTFTTYLLSSLANKLEPKKILVFGDGRQLVERIANQAQSLDYSLVADRILCYIILSEGPQPLAELQRKAGNLLHEIYIERTPLAILSRRKKIYGLPTSMQENLDALRGAYIRKIKYELAEPRSRLFRSALLTFDVVNKYGTPLEKAFVHTILSQILTGLFSHSIEKVGAEWFRIVETKRIRNRIQKYSGFQSFFESDRFDTLLTEIVEGYDGLRKDTEITFGNEKRDLDEECIILDPRFNNLKMLVPSSVSYCENCYEGFPTDELSQCPYCSGKLNQGERFKPASPGKCASGKGYLENKRDDAKWILDHWAKDILSHAIAWNKRFPNPQSDKEELLEEGIEHMVVLSHRAGIPQSIRSEIEEGFKRKTPTVNAVCATPTMELGIDIGTLNQICQVGIPPTKTNYIQRAGRTGRKMTVPSLIFTIIRNQNYVDSYFLTDLSERFLNREITSIFIPKPSHSILVNQIFVETLQFLNTRQDRLRSQYPIYYSIFPTDESSRRNLASQSVETIFKYVVRHVLFRLSQDVLLNYDEVTSHLKKVFQPFLIDVEEYLNEIFYGTESRLMKSVSDVFEKLGELYKETQQDKVKREFIDGNSVLGLFVQNINLFTEFRGIGPSIPVFDQHGKLLEIKSISYALREGYPGPYEAGKIKRGAQWGIEARKFDITKVVVKPVSLLHEDQKIMMCTNAGTCDNPFETYPADVEKCPWCDCPLEVVQVYEYRFGQAKVASSHPWTSRINTRPLLKTQVISDK